MEGKVAVHQITRLEEKDLTGSKSLFGEVSNLKKNQINVTIVYGVTPNPPCLITEYVSGKSLSFGLI